MEEIFDLVILGSGSTAFAGRTHSSGAEQDGGHDGGAADWRHLREQCVSTIDKSHRSCEGSSRRAQKDDLVHCAFAGWPGGPAVLAVEATRVGLQV
jgi:hypothetical protein